MKIRARERAYDTAAAHTSDTGMGVQNLWVLLAPVGRQIEIESLAHKVLAVDASIWLTQFVKAMRDDEGNMIKNAHLIGTFHRVAKLLFYGIKPVFIFDGDTPAIKKKTTAARRRRQEHQASNLKQTAQRILINRLKLQREQMKRNGGKAAPAVDANFVLPEAKAPSKEKDTGGDTESKASRTPLVGGAASAIEIDGGSDGDDELQMAQAKSSTGQEQQQQQQQKEESIGGYEEADSDEDDLTIDDIVLDTSRIAKIDLQAVFALPAHLQKDMINRILSDRRQEVRNQFIPLAGKPEAYSHTQISSFLATTALHRRIEAAKKKNREKQTEALGAGSPQGAKLGPGKRIASRSDRFFVYKKASEGGSNNSDDGEEEAKVSGMPTLSDSEDEDQGAPGYGMSVVNDIERFADEAKGSSVFASGGDDADAQHGNPFPLLTRFKKRGHRNEDAMEMGKTSLADFSIGSVKEFAAQAERQQRRKWAVQEAAAAWMAKSATQAKAEPTLAIEQARRKRLKIEYPVVVTDAADQKTDTKRADEETKSICITIKTDDVDVADDKYLELFPASIFEDGKANTAVQAPSAKAADTAKLIDGGDDEDDDVEWEDASAATATDAPAVVKEKLQETPDSDTTPTADTAETLETATIAETAGTDEEEDDVEWEEVEQLEQQEKEPSRPEQPLAVIEELNSDGDVLSDAANPEFTDEDEEIQDGNDEMYLSLKSELEDAKAEEDLEELRGEALKSALATASNLTQWAAGAVRRALAAHSLQHKQFVDSTHPVTGKASPVRGYGVTMEDVIEVAEEEDDSEEETKSDESATAAHINTVAIDVEQEEDKSGQEVTSMDVDANEVSEDAQLQIAIANSISEDLKKPRVSRYLQYASSPPTAPFPPQSAALDQVVDVAAIQTEQIELKKLRNRQMRDVEGFNDDMVEDVMELLRLFGVPYLVCPMEAEAQCAALEQLGLVDGIITDDSDIFPFGGKKVYKNIFHNQKFVEAFFAKDIEQELGFSQEEMISLALLLGSDYTDGIRGIGIVNATEVVNAYPGIDGLQEFKKWVQAFDLAEEAQRVADRKAKKSDEELAEMDVRGRFQVTHASVRRKWELGEEFPNAQVVKAYKQPQVDRSDARFSWSLPDLAALREYTGRTFGWDQQKADGVLLPLLEKAASSGRGVQTRIDQFFTTYDDQVRYAKIQSKRLRSAVEGRASNKTPTAATVSSGASAKSSAGASKSASKPKSTPAKKQKATKKTTTLAALGFAPKK